MEVHSKMIIPSETKKSVPHIEKKADVTIASTFDAYSGQKNTTSTDITNEIDKNCKRNVSNSSSANDSEGSFVSNVSNKKRPSEQIELVTTPDKQDNFQTLTEQSVGDLFSLPHLEQSDSGQMTMQSPDAEDQPSNSFIGSSFSEPISNRKDITSEYPVVLECCYPNRPFSKGCYYPSLDSNLSELADAQEAFKDQTKHRLAKQVSFGMNTEENVWFDGEKIPDTGRFSNDCTRHLTDSELLRQLYFELRHKLSLRFFPSELKQC